ncbi:hypothetical protein BJ165DRAFT_1510405 [Panaeolus papilionaceus]|nr:hypothetical protein BJ165DRAFT_1510405 [Panaeolus papilionaceus]
MEILSKHITPGALYDSDEQCNEPKVPDQAQNLVVSDLVAWASSPLSLQNAIKFVFGPAGSGKSTMARALCERLEKKELLAANFFFKWPHPDLGRRGLLIPTITYQLCMAIPAMQQHVAGSIQHDPAVLHRNLEKQLRQLIIQPFLKLKQQELPQGPLVIVIDGLDQCDDQTMQTYILRIFRDAVRTAGLPVRLLVFSRTVPCLMDVVAGIDVVGTLGLRLKLRPVHVSSSNLQVQIFGRCM